ncbi:MAG: class I SAM-dependent methyltransferase [Clostridiales bacterium]|nr:class I SAM-dependent methyltransferase [Clostridiales bacterium]
MQEKHNPDIVADCANLHFLPSNHYQEILAKDILEHIERIKTQAVLQEWARLLQTGGRLFLQVPSVLDLMKMIEQTDNVEVHLRCIHFLFGTQAYTGDYHLTSFTTETLTYYLNNAGFKIIKISLTDGWMFTVEATKN